MGRLSDNVVQFIRARGVPDASKALGISEALCRQWLNGCRHPSLRAAELVGELQPLLEQVVDIPAVDEPTETGYELNLGGSKVAFLLPWYRSANPFTAMSVLGLFDRSQTRCMMAHGDAFISHTRNRLAQLLLNSDCEWGLMVDDDMILPWGKPQWFKEATGFTRIPDANAGLNTLTRLLSHNKTLVGGLYLGKNLKDQRAMFAEGCSTREGKEAINSGAWRNQCLQTRWVATGCLLIHRRVFTDISARYPHLNGSWFSPSEHDLVAGVTEAMQLLQAPGDANARMLAALTKLSECKARADAVSKLGTGEDVIFSLRAAACGHIPHVDTGLILGHVGSYVFGPKWVY